MAGGAGGGAAWALSPRPLVGSYSLGSGHLHLEPLGGLATLFRIDYLRDDEIAHNDYRIDDDHHDDRPLNPPVFRQDSRALPQRQLR